MDITQHFKQYKSDDFVNWFVICALTEEGDQKETSDIITQIKDYDPDNYDLVMILNGVKLNPVKSLDRLKEAFDERVEKAAKDKFHSYLNDNKRKLDECVDRFAESLGIKLDEDDEY